jgi:SAM-dependent methyltransferase
MATVLSRFASFVRPSAPKRLIEGKHDTDKSQRYLDNYVHFFHPLACQPICLLEIGVLRGGSLLMWREYFGSGQIVGLDIASVNIGSIDRIAIYQGRQDDPFILDKIAAEQAPDGFDIIIDDASHLGTETRNTFIHCFPKLLKPGGIYVIEDWGTGYWGKWEDGKDFQGHEANTDGRFPSHDYGMVGFIKQLVDHAATDDITKPGMTTGPVLHRMLEIDTITIVHGQVFVIKNRDAAAKASRV